MLKAEPGWIAKFIYPGSKSATVVPVVGWNAEGEPLLAGPDGRLRLPGDSGLGDLGDLDEVEYDPAWTVSTAVPGQGWVVRYSDKDGSVTNLPVVGFTFYPDGQNQVFTAFPAGLVKGNEDLNGDDVCLIPPGGWDFRGAGPSTPADDDAVKLRGHMTEALRLLESAKRSYLEHPELYTMPPLSLGQAMATLKSGLFKGGEEVDG